MPNYSLRQKALNNLLTGLKNLHCSYVITDSEGNTHTYGEDPKKKGSAKKGSRYGFGALRDYYGPWIKDLQPGDTTEIPCDRFDVTAVQAGVANMASDMWGSGSFMTSRNKEKNSLEVIRIL